MCMQKVNKVFLTEMDDLEARKFLLHKESYVAPNYPKYYNFKYLLEYGQELLGRQTLDDVDGLVIDRNYGDIPDVNYTIQFNKSKDSFRPNVIIHPLLLNCIGWSMIQSSKPRWIGKHIVKIET